ncbi:MAG: GntR family transcriptional regulator [Bacillota bacterium]
MAVKAGSMTDAVYSKLKGSIVTGAMEPGMILSENEVAAEFGCSRTPAREALQKLSLEGYVAVIPKRGYVITTPSVRDTSEGYQLREILEGESAFHAASKITPELLAQLEECTLADEGSLSPANYRFHSVIAEAAGNRRLKRLINRLIEEMNRVEELDPGMQTPGYMDEHWAIINALKARDGAAAKEAMVKHIRVSRDRVMKRI